MADKPSTLNIASITWSEFKTWVTDALSVLTDVIDSDAYVDGSIDTAHLADDAVTPAKMSAGGGNDSFTSAATGATTVLAAATVERAVLITVEVDETFADNGGTKSSFAIGETDDTDKFVAALNAGTAGDKVQYHGILTAAKALIVTATAAVGDGDGGITVTVLALPT